MTYNQAQLIYWINERDRIRVKREKGDPKPWSNNDVMRGTYFCNVDREDDKVTKWIRENWTCEDPYFYPIAMITARIFNLPSTLELIGQPEKHYFNTWLGECLCKLNNLKIGNKKIWNGAYIISTAGQKMSKVDYCMDVIEKAVQILPELSNYTTLQFAHKALMKVNGLASFLAAQVIADLKNSDGCSLQFATDWFTFSAPGPGSLRGLEWFWERKVTAKTYQEDIQSAWTVVKPYLSSHLSNGKICMQNFQNCLCEYDKFMRVSTGTGRSKRKYNGSNNS